MIRTYFVVLSLALFVALHGSGGLARAQSVQWDTIAAPRSLAYLLALDTYGRVYAIGDSVLKRSTDNGLTWTNMGIFRRLAQSISVDSLGTIVLGNDALGLFRSTDNGVTWSSSLVTEGCAALAFHPRGTLFAGLTYTGNGKVNRSTNRGDTWTAIPLPNASGSFAAGPFAFGTNNESYAGSIDGFYRSTDLGVTWTQLNSGLSGLSVHAMVVSPNQNIIIETTYSASIDGLYRSTDRGQLWQRASTGTLYFNALASSSSGRLYGTTGTGIFTSTNEGLTWTDITGNMGTSQNLTSIVVTPDGHIITGGYRMFRSRTALTGVTVFSSNPATFSLAQNYPNPFNPTTTIRYSVPEESNVTLSVFDMLGREVATILNARQTPGTHSVTFDGSKLGSGAYVYRLRAGESVQTRTLVLLR